MDAVISDYDHYERFARRYEWLYAHSDTLKREAYRLRSAEDPSRNPCLNIDAHDAYAHHILLQHRDARQVIAATRIIVKADLAPGTKLPIEQSMTSDFHIASANNALEYPSGLSEMSSIHTNHRLLNGLGESESLVCLSLCLASYSLARLLFHDYLLTRLPLDQFKRFRASGLKYEYACEVNNPDHAEAAFYLDLNTDIRESSAIYAFSQKISDQLAPYVNLPILQEREA